MFDNLEYVISRYSNQRNEEEIEKKKKNTVSAGVSEFAATSGDRTNGLCFQCNQSKNLSVAQSILAWPGKSIALGIVFNNST